MNRIFTERAWEDYVLWQTTDRKMLKVINRLLDNIERTPFTGLGKPEPLKGDRSGWWSRRIDDTHRLVYRVSSEGIQIAACRTHYE